MNSPECCDDKFHRLAAKQGLLLSEIFSTAGSYAPVVLHEKMVSISGQVPRVGDAIAVTGRLGRNLSESEGYEAARICALRGLAILKDAAGGSLRNVHQILKISVYVQCDENFDEISAVANGASDTLVSILGTAGVHARTSLGVYRLPKNAAVEVEMTAILKPADQCI